MLSKYMILVDNVVYKCESVCGVHNYGISIATDGANLLCYI